MNEPNEIEGIVAEVLARLAGDQPVRQPLPHGGLIHLERQLPFLCVYRRSNVQDAAAQDAAGEQLVTAETAYLIAPAEKRGTKPLSEFVRRLAESLAEHFGAFLLVEVWAAVPETPAIKTKPRGAAERPGPANARPGFVIHVGGVHPPRKTLESLARALRKVKVQKHAAEVRIDDQSPACPPSLKPLLKALRRSSLGGEAKRPKVYTIGIEVRPIYLDPQSGAVDAAVLRAVRRGLARALKQAFFTFARNRTNIRAEHYSAFGKRTVVKLVWEVDRQLAEVGDSFDLLLQTTPVNAEAAWSDFRRRQFEQAPAFHYRPLAVEPTLLKRKLFAIPIEKIEDPTLAFLFRQKQDELDRKITMLSDIGTARFLPESLQVFGRVSEPLLRLAQDLLERIAPQGGESLRGQYTAEHFARLAQEEIAWYQQAYPAFTATVNVRADMFAGLLVSGAQLLVGGKTRIPARRVEALLQHEIGTHLVTYFNGRAQPFRQLDLGLAGYDGLQEGLAVLSEYLVGGLSRARMRLLAGRVVAVHALTQGASFVETFGLLAHTHQFPQRTAYTVTMRVYRGGGLTKDMVYLLGLVQILEYLRTGGDLEPLLIGKIAADHIALIGELRLRKVLHPPPLRPRYLSDDSALARLAEVRTGLSVLQLIDARRDGDGVEG